MAALIFSVIALLPGSGFQKPLLHGVFLIKAEMRGISAWYLCDPGRSKPLCADSLIPFMVGPLPPPPPQLTTDATSFVPVLHFLPELSCWSRCRAVDVSGWV